jgi:hypothetical protein
MRDERAIGDYPDESRGHPHRAGSCEGKWDEREQVVLVIEQELHAARRELPRLLPARDGMALIAQATRDVAALREQLDTPKPSGPEAGVR